MKAGPFQLLLPGNYEILGVRSLAHDVHPVLWALIDDDKEERIVRFRLVDQTDDEDLGWDEALRFIGTLSFMYGTTQIRGPRMVWRSSYAVFHVFEVLEESQMGQIQREMQERS